MKKSAVLLQILFVLFTKLQSAALATQEEETVDLFSRYLAQAEASDAEAQVVLGYMYETGDGVGQDYEQAA